MGPESASWKAIRRLVIRLIWRGIVTPDTRAKEGCYRLNCPPVVIRHVMSLRHLRPLQPDPPVADQLAACIGRMPSSVSPSRCLSISAASSIASLRQAMTTPSSY
jgi:hypothetical protein